MRTPKLVPRMIRWSRAILILVTVSLMADPQAEAACPGLKGTFLQLTDGRTVRR